MQYPYPYPIPDEQSGYATTALDPTTKQITIDTTADLVPLIIGHLSTLTNEDLYTEALNDTPRDMVARVQSTLVSLSIA